MRPPCSSALLGLAILGLFSACGGWRGYGDTYYRKWERGPVKHEATYRFGMGLTNPKSDKAEHRHQIKK